MSLIIRTFKEGDEYVAMADEVAVHAFGATEEEARRNLADELRNDYRFLSANAHRLAPHMARMMERLKEVVEG